MKTRSCTTRPRGKLQVNEIEKVISDGEAGRERVHQHKVIFTFLALEGLTRYKAY